MRGATLVFGCIILSVAMPPSSGAQDSELRILASSLASQIKAKGQGPVAVSAFRNCEYGPAFSSYVLDRLNILLARDNSAFAVVARSRVDDAFKEIDLSLSKYYDASTFAKIGKQLGARSIIRGSYVVRASSGVVSIVGEILDVESGRLIGGEEVIMQLTGDLRAMLSPTGSCGTGAKPAATVSGDVGKGAKCAAINTGHYGFANKFERTPVTVFLDVAGRSRSISVQVGQTQYFYDVPAGPHDYRVQFQAMRPLMPFPPGAPLMETTVIYAEGQVFVEPCRSPVYDIKNAPPPGGGTSVGLTSNPTSDSSIPRAPDFSSVGPAERATEQTQLRKPLISRERVDFLFYFGAVHLTLTGGDATGYTYPVGDRAIPLHPAPSPSVLIVYGGRTSSRSGIGVDIELSLHDKNLQTGSLGVSYEPSWTLGSTGLAAVIIGTGKIAFAQQNLGTLTATSASTGGKLQVVNWGLGWDFGGGMAYQFKRGSRLAVDWRIRRLNTFSRHILAPSGIIAVDDRDIPWSPFAGHGSILRISFTA
jgi:hypothetical protein